MLGRATNLPGRDAKRLLHHLGPFILVCSRDEVIPDVLLVPGEHEADFHRTRKASGGRQSHGDVRDRGETCGVRHREFDFENSVADNFPGGNFHHDTGLVEGTNGTRGA